MANSDNRGSILIVDDETINLDILSEALDDDYDLMYATNGRDAIEAAQEALPDLILLDVMMPEMDGYQVCSLLKADAATADIPVIFLTGLSSSSDELKGLEVGAADYIAKPISVPIVRLRISNHMRLKKALTKLEMLSATDGLTEMANRRHLDERLERECNGSRKSVGKLSIILLDIDHFKDFNDTYGHQEGDECLVKVGRAISESVKRAKDLAARYGGEEFCCVLPDTTYEDATRIANRIRENVIALDIPNTGSSAEPIVTVSLGVVTIMPNGSVTPAQVIKMADDNLYAAKRAGRNRIVGEEMA
ncbi:MAG: diguanylate cyclase [Rhodospirillaceae bacterium]|nr:diguanylate cyclase [Rhodospirillaceae bacterium]MBT4491185.1 diguanylate cyclase [Rhodospirillaceae bacterium]MBT5194443.1 diguanylate cyclase [Rhodospirillaceae bacterium]MBT6428804.1 diguanylate cyclase [Rhodospirillaceae bacterium]